LSVETRNRVSRKRRLHCDRKLLYLDVVAEVGGAEEAGAIHGCK